MIPSHEDTVARSREFPNCLSVSPLLRLSVSSSYLPPEVQAQIEMVNTWRENILMQTSRVYDAIITKLRERLDRAKNPMLRHIIERQIEMFENMKAEAVSRINSLADARIARIYANAEIDPNAIGEGEPEWKLVRDEIYAWDNWNLIATFSGSPLLQLSDSFLHGHEGMLAETRHVAAGTYLACRDGNKNITAYIDAATGAKSASYEYSPSGGTISKSGPEADKMTFRFAGYAHDVETGWTYLGHRYYDADRGRFPNPDPIGESGGVGLYVYGQNDLINNWDYLGLALYAFDGTANYPRQTHEGVNAPTNVFLMFGVYGSTKKWYEPGVGNPQEYSVWNPMRYLGQAFGAGDTGKIVNMYKKLIEYYLEGDHTIDIIGFSRGSIMAMKFAKKIERFGIPKDSSGFSIPQNSLGIDPNAPKHCPEIRFLGLFDPVPSPIGMKAPLNIPDIVEKTAIAYSIDEKRVAFKPAIPSGRNIIMKPFPGGHSDIGGGYKQAGLSRNAMKWMVDQGGTPFSMPLIGSQTEEQTPHQENQWHWSIIGGYGQRVLPAGTVP